MKCSHQRCTRQASGGFKQCLTCRNRKKLSVTKWRQVHPGGTASIQLKYYYGITLEQKTAMLLAQGNCCAVCKTTEPRGRHGWCIDHDHSCCSGKRSCGKCIRGILCHYCNCALGYVKDSSETLEQLSLYLKSFKN